MPSLPLFRNWDPTTPLWARFGNMEAGLREIERERLFILKLVLGCVTHFCGKYQNWTYIFASPTCLWKVMARVLIGSSDLFESIDCFGWSKISFEFSIQSFFCWFLTCIYCIYCISAHWYRSLSSGVLANCMWPVSKSGIQLWFPWRFVEGCGEVAGCVISFVVINLLAFFKSIIQSSFRWLFILLIKEVR